MSAYLNPQQILRVRRVFAGDVQFGEEHPLNHADANRVVYIGPNKRLKGSLHEVENGRITDLISNAARLTALEGTDLTQNGEGGGSAGTVVNPMAGVYTEDLHATHIYGNTTPAAPGIYIHKSLIPVAETPVSLGSLVAPFPSIFTHSVVLNGATIEVVNGELVLNGQPLLASHESRITTLETKVGVLDAVDADIQNTYHDNLHTISLNGREGAPITLHTSLQPVTANTMVLGTSGFPLQTVHTRQLRLNGQIVDFDPSEPVLRINGAPFLGTHEENVSQLEATVQTTQNALASIQGQGTGTAAAPIAVTYTTNAYVQSLRGFGAPATITTHASIVPNTTQALNIGSTPLPMRHIHTNALHINGSILDVSSGVLRLNGVPL